MQRFHSLKLRSFLTVLFVLKRFNSNKPLYVTTPIFYVNAAPHLGHLYSMLLGDVRNRWEVLQNKKTFFTTGTDEHGLKVQEAAEKAGKGPQEFVDDLSDTFKDLAAKLNIKYDRFIRTTDKDHMEAVIHFWNIVQQKGYIYKGEHSGWYSVSDETFFPELQIEEVEKEGKKLMISKETGNEVIYQNETNYFFKLSEFYDDIIKLMENNKRFIIPRSRQLEILKDLKNNGKLNDLSISRPSSRLKWGIRVPGDESQTIYVWFDALVNYLTSSSFPLSKFTEVWPATHIVGKDIVKFHTIYWPAFLMAAGIDIPKQVVVHGHWLCEGKKMSKSRGNIVKPLEMASYYGVDPLRFYLCENSVLENDGSFSENGLFNSRKNLSSQISNLIVRCCGTAFNIQDAIEKYSNNIYAPLPENSELPLVEVYNDILKCIDEFPGKLDHAITNFKLVDATEHIWELTFKANRLFQLGEPWKAEYSGLPNEVVLFTAIDSARIISITLKPFIPQLADAFLDRINVNKEKRTLEYAKIGADLSYGKNLNYKGDLPMEKLNKRS